jgi:hypothetical protein
MMQYLLDGGQELLGRQHNASDLPLTGRKLPLET